MTRYSSQFMEAYGIYDDQLKRDIETAGDVKSGYERFISTFPLPENVAALNALIFLAPHAQGRLRENIDVLRRQLVEGHALAKAEAERRGYEKHLRLK